MTTYIIRQLNFRPTLYALYASNAIGCSLSAMRIFEITIYYGAAIKLHCDTFRVFQFIKQRQAKAYHNIIFFLKFASNEAHGDLYFDTNKVQLSQELEPTGHVQRRQFVKWIMGQQNMDVDFSNKIFFIFSFMDVLIDKIIALGVQKMYKLLL